MYIIDIWKEDTTERCNNLEWDNSKTTIPEYLTWIDAPSRIIGGIELRIEDDKVYIRKFKIKTVNKSFDKEETIIERAEIIEYLTKWVSNLKRRNKESIQYSYACSRKDNTLKFNQLLEILSN